MTTHWSRQAHESLGKAIAWWLTSDARGLDRWLAELRRQMETIQRFPQAGKIVERSLDRSSRSVLVEPYRLFYTWEENGDEVWITELRHLRREPPPHLDLLK